MKKLIIITLFLTFFSCSSQKEALTYNSKRKLKADTSLIISEKAFKLWTLLEEDLIYHTVRNYSPHPFFEDNNISTNCIYRFSIDSLNFCCVSIIQNDFTSTNQNKIDSLLVSSFVDFLNRIDLKKILSEKGISDINKDLVFYLPIYSTYKTAEKFINDNGYIKRESPQAPLIMPDSHK